MSEGLAMGMKMQAQDIVVKKSHPIIFSAPMVRAILDGRKTQTRRVIKSNSGPRPDNVSWCAARFDWWCDPGGWINCPYGRPGDQLWVREHHWIVERYGRSSGSAFLLYDDEWTEDGLPDQTSPDRPWRGQPDHHIRFGPRPSIHMPRWASRIQLEVAGIRVEWLQGMSWKDALAEGIVPTPCDHPDPKSARLGCTECMGTGIAESPVDEFAELWDSINAKRGHGWETNPWVWVIEFSRVVERTGRRV